MRHSTFCGFSPGMSRDSAPADQRGAADHHLALFAKYSGTIGMFSRWMYCHTSSSVQLESGNTRMLSPGHAPVRGSTARAAGSWDPTDRSCRERRRSRSLARDFSSSRRAPPMAASKLPACSAVEQRLGLEQAAALLGAELEGLRAVVDRSWFMWTISCAPIACANRRGTRSSHGTCRWCRRGAAETGSGPGRRPSAPAAA